MQLQVCIFPLFLHNPLIKVSVSQMFSFHEIFRQKKYELTVTSLRVTLNLLDLIIYIYIKTLHEKQIMKLVVM